MNGPLSHGRGGGGGGSGRWHQCRKHTNEENFIHLPSDSFPTMKKKEIGIKASEQQSVRSIMPE